jgi:hypothetical protein
MKNGRLKEWMWPPLDQWIGVWGLIVIAVFSMVTSWLLTFFSGLTGAPWIWGYMGAVCVALVGVGFLFYAKLPLYRERRFFTFGPGPLPQQRRSAYWWGYRCAIFAVILFACLALSKH